MKRTKEVYTETMEELSEIEDNSSDALKQRVITAKKRLPKYISGIFIHIYPEYKSGRQKALLTNVLQLRQSDKDITEKLEKLVSKFNQ